MRNRVVAVSVVLVVCAGLAGRHGVLPALGGTIDGERRQIVEAQPNHRDGTFRNDLPLNESLGAVARAIFGDKAGSARPAEMLRLPGTKLPGAPAALAATWMGHSTVYLEVDGARKMFDPMWSDNASPLSGVGPARYLVPPIPLEDIADVDVVVISHDHYDHLDMGSIERLAQRGGVRFVVPLGIGAHLEAWGVQRDAVTELGWWQEGRVGDVRLVCTPARHFSGRDVSDRFATRWSGWAVVGSSSRVYFSGDSGYGPHFAEIGRRLGPFDLTLIESGSYGAAWPDVHLGPEQALRAHRDVHGRHLLPVHWSAFVMGNHGWTEPGERLLAASTASDGLILPTPGQRVVVGDDLPAAVRWWPPTPWLPATEAPIVSSAPALSE